jgi:hypothetical protein
LKIVFLVDDNIRFFSPSLHFRGILDKVFVVRSKYCDRNISQCVHSGQNELAPLASAELLVTKLTLNLVHHDSEENSNPKQPFL